MENWKKICALDEIPPLGSRVVKLPNGKGGDIAVFRTDKDEVFALHDKCPHKGGPLSQGLLAGKVVTCPLHSWKIRLENGEAVAPDHGCTRPYSCKVEGGWVWIAI